MKNLLLSILLFISIDCFSQELKLNLTLVDTTAFCIGKLEVVDFSYNVHQTIDKYYYILYFDVSGDLHKQELGYLTEHKYEDISVFTNEIKTKHWYFIVGKNGLPCKVLLDEFMFE